MQDIDWYYESELTAGIANHFRDAGWVVATEVWSDNRDGRIDLLVEHPAVGRVGIEVKSMHGYSGTDFGKGIGQLLRYRELQFGGEPLDYWVFDPVIHDRARHGIHGGQQFKKFRDMMQSTVNRLGFGYLNHFKQELVFRPAPRLAISIRKPNSVTSEVIDSIGELVSDRVEKLPSNRGVKDYAEQHGIEFEEAYAQVVEAGLESLSDETDG